MSFVIIKATLVFAVDMDWSIVNFDWWLLAMEESLSILIAELLFITFFDFFKEKIILWSHYYC